jgi:hypothetical protein
VSLNVTEAVAASGSPSTAALTDRVRYIRVRV